MHKRDQESLLIQTLADGYTITVACKRASVSRMFYNRHYRSDIAFRKKVDDTRLIGKQTNDDRVLSAFMKKINDGHWPAIRYYLQHNMAQYMDKGSVPPPTPPRMRPVQQDLTEADTYAQFIRWSAMTPEERTWDGIETREQFCKVYTVPNIKMLTVWSRRKDFEPAVSSLREAWVFSKTGDILGGVYTAARSGDHRSQRLWLEHVHQMKEKQDAKNPNQGVVTPEDVRFIIDGLPEPLKSQNQIRLREILDDAVAASRAGKLQEYKDAGIVDDKGEIMHDPPMQIFDL